MAVNLACFNNDWYDPGAGVLKRTAWYCINAIVFSSWLFPVSKPKGWLLRLFGARVGARFVIKPRVNIKYPWRLQVGDNVWIGEGVWIDNLADIVIGSNVCISQDAYLLTGNHDYKDEAFGLLTKGIIVEDGAWIAARTTICPGVVVSKGSIVTVGTILSKDSIPNGIYRGNSAKLAGMRQIGSGPLTGR